MLDIRGCVQIGDEGLEELKDMPSLTSLKMRSPNLGDAGMNRLKGLKKLRNPRRAGRRHQR